ncbi:hypothetical protein M0R45_007145 [Rubus argutus]|uniref:Uncharacterized protein n=1 Tax=Rubus argutus TaxID=59490 RepID=A0AAW1YTY5_RUBAR
MDSLMEAVIYKIATIIPWLLGSLHLWLWSALWINWLLQSNPQLGSTWPSTFLLQWTCGDQILEHLCGLHSELQDQHENLLKQVKQLKAARDMVRQAVEDAKQRGQGAIKSVVEKCPSSLDRSLKR